MDISKIIMKHNVKFKVAYLNEGCTTTRLSLSDLSDILLKIPNGKATILMDKVIADSDIFYPDSAIGKVFKGNINDGIINTKKVKKEEVSIN